MKYYGIDKSALSSLTVAPHDISCLLVPAGTRIHDGAAHKVYTVMTDAYIVADYVHDVDVDGVSLPRLPLHLWGGGGTAGNAGRRYLRRLRVDRAGMPRPCGRLHHRGLCPR